MKKTNRYTGRNTTLGLVILSAITFTFPLLLEAADSGKTSSNKRGYDFTNNIVPSVCISSVIKGSLAESVGIKTGDTLFEVNAKLPTNTVDAAALIKSAGLDFSVVVGDRSGQRTLEIKRKDGESLGVELLDQLPAGRLPFGYVLKWYDGIVLDFFHGKLKQAEIVLNPYNLQKETAHSLKTKDGDEISGGTIPCGEKYIYVDSEGRQFVIVNELINLPAGDWSLTDLQQTPQWPMLQLQPFWATLATQANEQKAQVVENVKLQEQQKAQVVENVKLQEQQKIQQQTQEAELAKQVSDRQKQYEIFRTGNLNEAIEAAKQEKANNKLVFKNLYPSMPLKNAVVILESLLGEKLDFQGDSQHGYRIGRYPNVTPAQMQSVFSKQAQLKEMLGTEMKSSFISDGTIVTADVSGNCVGFYFGRKDLDKIYKTPELEGINFFHEFTKNYNIEFDLDAYIPKTEEVKLGEKYVFGVRSRYETLDSRGAKLIFYVNKYFGDTEKYQATFLGLENDALVIQAVASQSQRKEKFD